MTSKPTQAIDTDQSIKKTFTFYGRPMSIIIICTVLCIFWTIMLANNWSLLVTTFSRFFGPYSAQILFNQLFLSCSIFFVWKMKLVGRIMVSLWCVINLVGNFLLLRVALEMYTTDFNNQIFPTTNPYEFIFPIVFLFGLMYYINRKSVRVLFRK